MNRAYFLKQLQLAKLSGAEIAQESLIAVISEIDLELSKKNLSEKDVEKILNKEAKKFSEASESLRDLDVDKSLYYKECEKFLRSFLPKPVPREDYESVANILLPSCANFGELMKEAKSQFGTRLDMKEFSEIAKKLF